MISVLEKKYKNIEGLEIEGSAYESKNKKIKNIMENIYHLRITHLMLFLLLMF